MTGYGNYPPGLAYVDSVILIGNDIRTVEINSDVLLKTCKDIGWAVNTGKVSTWKWAWLQIGISG